MKKIIAIFAIAAIFLSMSFFIETPARASSLSDARTGLRKALYEYLQNPGGSTIGKEKIKDLLEFYLSIPEGQTTADGSFIGANSGTRLDDIVNQAKGLNKTIPICFDGTEYGACSQSKPLMCYSGSLVGKCGICGCMQS
jgi:hypothetical protein